VEEETFSMINPSAETFLMDGKKKEAFGREVSAGAIAII